MTNKEKLESIALFLTTGQFEKLQVSDIVWLIEELQYAWIAHDKCPKPTLAKEINDKLNQANGMSEEEA